MQNSEALKPNPTFKGMYMPAIFTPFYTMETAFVTSCVLSYKKKKPFRQGIYSQREELSSKDRKFFPSRVDFFFQKGCKTI